LGRYTDCSVQHHCLHFDCAATAILKLQVVFPGQVLCKLPSSGQLRLGSGLQTQAETVCTIKAGILHKTKTGKLWLEGRQKRCCLTCALCMLYLLPAVLRYTPPNLFHRYIPAVEESVIGIITQKYGESFDVDIGGPFTATLPVLAFEGATRRNRPNLQVCEQHKLGMPSHKRRTFVCCLIACTKGTVIVCKT